MRRVLWRWRGITVHSYPVMLWLGLVFGIAAGGMAARASGLDARRVEIASLILMVPALIGARLLYVVTHWPLYRREPRRIWGRGEGGAAMYGGFALALACSSPVLARAGLGFGAFWDVATFTILVGMMFTRVGCLLNGCCSGRPTNGRCGLRMPNAHAIWKRRIPMPLLEMGLAAMLLCGAVLLWPRMPFPGGLFLYLLAGYGAGRAALEIARETPARINLVISPCLVLLALIAFIVAWAPAGGHRVVSGPAPAAEHDTRRTVT